MAASNRTEFLKEFFQEHFGDIRTDNKINPGLGLIDGEKIRRFSPQRAAFYNEYVVAARDPKEKAARDIAFNIVAQNNDRKALEDEQIERIAESIRYIQSSENNALKDAVGPILKEKLGMDIDFDRDHLFEVKKDLDTTYQKLKKELENFHHITALIYKPHKELVELKKKLATQEASLISTLTKPEEKTIWNEYKQYKNILLYSSEQDTDEQLNKFTATLANLSTAQIEFNNILELLQKIKAQKSEITVINENNSSNKSLTDLFFNIKDFQRSVSKLSTTDKTKHYGKLSSFEISPDNYPFEGLDQLEEYIKHPWQEGGTGTKVTDQQNQQKDQLLEKINRFSAQLEDQASPHKLEKIKNLLKYDPDVSIKNIEPNNADRIIFIIFTYFLQSIALFFVEWMMTINLVTYMSQAVLVYLIAYLCIFALVVGIVAFAPMSLTNLLFMFSIRVPQGTVRVLLHTVPYFFMFVLWSVLKMRQIENSYRVLTFMERKKLLRQLNKITFALWVITSGVAFAK